MKQVTAGLLLATAFLSCSKAATEKEENNFVSMNLQFYMTANPCTGYYFLSDDTANSMKYNADVIPPNTGITAFPVTVQVSFHDLPNRCGSTDLIFIDAIKK